MEPWVQYAVEYIRSWIEFQMRTTQQPGCITAIAAAHLDHSGIRAGSG